MAFARSVSFHHLRHVWPDGTVALDDLTGAFSPGVTGLVGRNGAGKSTLLRLIAGDLTPTPGTVTVDGRVSVLPQLASLRAERTVADALGITPIRNAIAAIEAGDIAEAHFETIGEAWDVDAAATVALSAVGLTQPDLLERPLSTLSGGQIVLVGLARLGWERPDIAIMDEPTNNLDRDARANLLEAISHWRGTLIVASHDRELLARVDRIAEVHGRALRTFDGPYETYREAIAAEQEAAERDVRDATATLRREKRERIEANEKRQRSMAAGRALGRSGSLPKILVNGRQNAAEKTTAASRALHAGREADAEAALHAAQDTVRKDRSIRIALPDTEIASSRMVLELSRENDGPLLVRGPERISLAGGNGAGKSMLLAAIQAGSDAPARDAVARVTRRIPESDLLRQDLAVADEDATVMDTVRSGAPDTDPAAVRAILAQFLFRGDAAERRVRELSGGERVRLALATALGRRPAPLLLMLDEPTNNLDLDAIEQLEAALQAYRGALIVVSHDAAFLDRIGITRRWRIEAGDLVEETV